MRDLSGIHGTYRKVEETAKAIQLIGIFLEERKIKPVWWYFDSPVSNSGRLKTLLGQIAATNAWQWTIDLAINPDKILIAAQIAVASSDSVILDACRQWVNLGSEIISRRISCAWVINLNSPNAIGCDRRP
jgi:hypothetical protein